MSHVSRWAADLTLALDPREVLRRNALVPDPWQERLLLSTSPRVVVVAARQQGKGTAAAALALHLAMFRRGLDVVMISKSLAQSRELLKRTKALFAPFAGRWRLTSDTAGSIAFGTGSRILSVPAGDAARGYSPKLLILDEVGFIPDDVIAEALPLVAATQGRIVALSTPPPRRGWLWDVWHEGGDDWERIHVAACDNPRLDAEQVARDRALMGESRARREFDAEFVLDDDPRNPRVLSPDAIARLFVDAGPEADAPAARPPV